MPFAALHLSDSGACSRELGHFQLSVFVNEGNADTLEDCWWAEGVFLLRGHHTTRMAGAARVHACANSAHF